MWSDRYITCDIFHSGKCMCLCVWATEKQSISVCMRAISLHYETVHQGKGAIDSTIHAFAVSFALLLSLCMHLICFYSLAEMMLQRFERMKITRCPFIKLTFYIYGICLCSVTCWHHCLWAELQIRVWPEQLFEGRCLFLCRGDVNPIIFPSIILYIHHFDV